MTTTALYKPLCSLQKENDEACLAVLNNFYGDGVVWHDIACHHKKYFVCEDNPELIEFIEQSEDINLDDD